MFQNVLKVIKDLKEEILNKFIQLEDIFVALFFHFQFTVSVLTRSEPKNSGLLHCKKIDLWWGIVRITKSKNGSFVSHS